MQRIKVEEDKIVLDTSALSSRVVFSIIAVVLAVPAIYRSYGIFRADRIVRSEQTFESYSRALQNDPSNAILWWHRGRLRHYSVGLMDISRAMSDYRKALALNPRLSQAWVDLADCYERTGYPEEAEAALEKAFATHTYSPIIRWQAGNFFLRRGNLLKMYECFKMASEYDSEKLGIAMEIAWKADSDRTGILQKLIPDNLPSHLSYLGFLVARDELDLARPVWERCQQDEIPADLEFKVSSSFEYIDHLLVKNRVTEALKIWDDTLQKAGTGLHDTRLALKNPQDHGSNAENLVWNGSFENEILRGGFDWRYPEMSEVQIQTDLANRMEGLKCLRVAFGGTNISFAHLSQIIPVFEPGSYQLDFYLRTEGLTTDRTPYMFIQGYPDVTGASARTNAFPASNPWSKVSIPFTVKEGCRAIQLILRRDPSSKFDNQIKGSLWLDGVSVHRQQVSRTSALYSGCSRINVDKPSWRLA